MPDTKPITKIPKNGGNMSFIEDLSQQMGTTAANAGLGTIMGLAMEKHNDARQLRQATALQNLDIEGQQRMLQSQYDLQMKMWNETNYTAQMKQLAKAGLNPALLYGMGGGGGQTTGQQHANVSQGQTNQNPGEIQGSMATMLQMQNMDAQRKLTEAQTENVQADTQSKLKQPANIEADTGLKLANTGNAQADTALKQVEKQLKDFDLMIKNATTEELISIVTMQAAKITEEVNQAIVKTSIDRATQQDKIDQVHNELLNTITQGALMKATTGKTKEETALITKQVNTFMDKLESDMQLQQRLGQSQMTNATSNEVQAQIQRDRLEWEKDMHDVPDSTKMVVDVVEKAIQAIIVGRGLKGASGKVEETLKQHNRRMFRKHAATDVLN